MAVGAGWAEIIRKSSEMQHTGPSILSRTPGLDLLSPTGIPHQPPSPGFQPPSIPTRVLSTVLWVLRLGEKGLRVGGGWGWVAGRPGYLAIIPLRALGVEN